jgi:hypothetical protein
MKATLNVGLIKSTNGEAISDNDALAALRKFFKIEQYRFADSATERTLVATVSFDESWNDACFALALTLDQDRIAICFGQYGELIGPRAEAWGDFNHDYFITF